MSPNGGILSLEGNNFTSSISHKPQETNHLLTTCILMCTTSKLSFLTYEAVEYEEMVE